MIKMYIGPDAWYRYSCLILMELNFYRQIFRTTLKREISRDSRFVQCRQTGGWTDITKLIVTLCSFANAPTNSSSSSSLRCGTNCTTAVDTTFRCAVCTMQQGLVLHHGNPDGAHTLLREKIAFSLPERTV